MDIVTKSMSKSIENVSKSFIYIKTIVYDSVSLVIWIIAFDLKYCFSFFSSLFFSLLVFLCMDFVLTELLIKKSESKVK